MRKEVSLRDFATYTFGNIATWIKTGSFWWDGLAALAI